MPANLNANDREMIDLKCELGERATPSVVRPSTAIHNKNYLCTSSAELFPVTSLEAAILGMKLNTKD